MFIVSFPAAALATNCYVIALGRGQTGAPRECVVVDPGVGVLDDLKAVSEEYNLKPVAVVLTHGHLDHTYAVPELSESGLPIYIHARDRYRLVDPYNDLGPQLRAALESQFGPASSWCEPAQVREFHDREELDLAGLRLTVLGAPGHTEGSALLCLEGVPDALDEAAANSLTQTVLSGDVLFAGSVGRTDLPGGNPDIMAQTLRDVVLKLPDEALVLPGHGPATTMAQERSTNPYLQGLIA